MLKAVSLYYMIFDSFKSEVICFERMVVEQWPAFNIKRDLGWHLCNFGNQGNVGSYALSGIQVRSPVITCPAGGYRNCDSVQDHDGWMELRTSGSEVTLLKLKMISNFVLVANKRRVKREAYL